MKVLVIQDTYFELPNDFSGTLADALRLMADYTESKKDFYFTEVAEKDDDTSPYDEVMNYIDDILIKKGSRVNLTYGMLDIDTINEKYVTMFSPPINT